jgi:hypothetical protein
MKKAGQLIINNNVPEVGGMPLALYLANDMFQGARDLLQNMGISSGENVSVKGTCGLVDGQTVLFVSRFSKFFMTPVAAAGSLEGDPIPVAFDFLCKQCSFLNTSLLYIDVNHPPNCKNPLPPLHSLKIL